MDWATLSTPVIIAVIPVVIALLKKLIPDRLAFVYPLLASGLGVALDYVNLKVTGGSLGPASGAILGLAAVGLREVIDQLKKARG